MSAHGSHAKSSYICHVSTCFLWRQIRGDRPFFGHVYSDLFHHQDIPISKALFLISFCHPGTTERCYGWQILSCWKAILLSLIDKYDNLTSSLQWRSVKKVFLPVSAMQLWLGELFQVFHSLVKFSASNEKINGLLLEDFWRVICFIQRWNCTFWCIDTQIVCLPTFAAGCAAHKHGFEHHSRLLFFPGSAVEGNKFTAFK